METSRPRSGFETFSSFYDLAASAMNSPLFSLDCLSLKHELECGLSQVRGRNSHCLPSVVVFHLRGPQLEQLEGL